MWGLAGLLALGLVLVAGRCHSLSFHLPAQTRKCLKDEFHKDVLVTGDYDVSEAGAPGIRTDLVVRSAAPLQDACLVQGAPLLMHPTGCC